MVPPPALYADQHDAGPALAPPYADPTGILRGPLRPAILRLALPAVGTTLFQVLFNITDTFWVGRTLGPEALAGVSLASYTVWVIVSVGELVGVGLSAVASRRHGEGDPDRAARAAGTALVMALLLGLVVAVGGTAALPAIFRLMQAQGRVAELAREFLVIQLVGAVLIYGYYVVTAAFRSAGDTRTPFVLLGTSVLLNLVLDPVMILGLGPMPALGVYGAALATVLTRGLGFLVGLELLRRRGGIRLELSLPVARTI
ncbi:MAG TPA: MATE family efflux transporter, partial [Gemmatimonadales bacterium]|nr:MATE family efflux transporter [Gemmatimonadales bacterium]